MMAFWTSGPRDALTAFMGVQSSTGVDKEQTRIKILVIFAFQASGRRPPKSFFCDKQTLCQAADQKFLPAASAPNPLQAGPLRRQLAAKGQQRRTNELRKAKRRRGWLAEVGRI